MNNKNTSEQLNKKLDKTQHITYTNVIKVFTGNDIKFRDASLAINIPGLTLEKIDDIDPPEIQDLDCQVVAIDKFQKMRNALPIYMWSLCPMLTEDTALHIWGNGMNGFPGAFIKYMEQTMGVDGMQERYAGCLATFVSTVVASINGIQYVFRNEQKGHISTCKPTGNNDTGFATIFVPHDSNIQLNDCHTVLAAMDDESRIKYSPRIRGYIQLHDAILASLP